MSCAACQARVEKAVSAVPGVSSCSVSLLTNTLGVEGAAAPSEVIKAVEAAGYGASIRDSEGKDKKGSYSEKLLAEEEALKDKTTPVLKKRLVSSVLFMLVLMYFSMGHMMLHLPLPGFFTGNPVAVGLMELMLSAIVMIINQHFFVSGFKSLFHGAPNMDSLIATGSSAAFIYSVIMLFKMTEAVTEGRGSDASAYLGELYFETAAMILTLITVGKLLESISKGRTTNALKSLMKLAPKTANVEKNGREETVPIDEVAAGDIFFVRPGESIPVDGVIIEGSSAVDEAALTGESIPVDKAIGDKVFSATLNRSGFLKCRAERVGEDSTLAQIIQMVSDAAATKAPIARLADRISGVFVPVVIGIALITVVVWLLCGESVGFSLARGICVLVVSCPCALGLATPVSIMVGNGVGARNGILFKNAESLQECGNIRIMALDKTGTITRGEPRVTDVYPLEGTDETELLRLALSLEIKSEHPLAKAVTEYARGLKLEPYEAAGVTEVAGGGLKGTISGRLILAGNARFIGSETALHGETKELTEKLASEGKTPLLFAQKGEADGKTRLLGMIAVADTIKEDSRQAIAELKKMGIRTVMLTGDNRRTAEAIGKEAGVDRVIAEVMPQDKESAVRDLMELGRTAMTGDGINDAPALTRADIGIAIGAGADVAIDAADIVLMKSRLTDASAAIRLSRRTYLNIKENLFWALFYNALLIPAAAGLYAKPLGITMNPMLGALAMSLSSFCVVSNALRLNLVDIRDASRDRRAGELPDLDRIGRKENKPREGREMTEKTMKIEGMMCAHCEATVKKALEAIDGVSEARVSHEDGCALVSMDFPVEDAVLKEAVEDKDYKVLDIA